MRRREFRYPRRLPTLLSPLILGRGGDLQVLRTRSRGDVRSRKDLSPLPHLRIQLKKFNLKLKMPLKWQLNLKLRKSLKDSILKMETPIREEYRMGTSERPHSVILGNQDEWVDDHEEIATNYVESGESYHRKTTIVDIYFSSKIVDSLYPYPEPKSMIQCRKHSDWDKWKAAIEAELRSLCKREVFGPAVPTPPNVIPVGCKWVFFQKRNEHGQMVRYKETQHQL
jgi:hypothetical protein